MTIASTKLPLSIMARRGVAILPAISQAIARGEDAEASDVRPGVRSVDALTLPATLALVVAAGPIIGALYQGGQITVEDARVTGKSLQSLSRPSAYVLVKVLTPAFYAAGCQDAGVDRHGRARLRIVANILLIR